MKYLMKLENFTDSKIYIKKFEQLRSKDYFLLRARISGKIKFFSIYNFDIEKSKQNDYAVKSFYAKDEIEKDYYTLFFRNNDVYDYKDINYDILYRTKDLEDAKKQYEIVVDAKKYNL